MNTPLGMTAAAEEPAVSSTVAAEVDIDQASGLNEVETDGNYAKYALCVLVLVYVVNFIDRNILAILAESIKADLEISDSDLGFLFGAAFAVFYAVFGIPLGRLADSWNRKRLIAIGLAFWSAMTALSGATRGFFALAACRIGVGIGEASASPAAYSLLADYFSLQKRTTAFAIYGSGLYLGAGVGLFLGGTILDAWNSLYPNPLLAPFGLKGWQVAFFAVGLPGFLLSLWVATLKEPQRGQSEGLMAPPVARPFRQALVELLCILPLSSLLMFHLHRAGGRAIAVNASIGLGLAALVALLIALTGDTIQWLALGSGVYCVTSWAQIFRHRDPVGFAMIFQCKTLIYTMLAMGCLAFIANAVAFWSLPYYQRVYAVSPSRLGLILGLSSAVAGFAGVILGGYISDKLRRVTRKGKLYVALISLLASLPPIFIFLHTDNLTVAYCSSFFAALAVAMPLASGSATMNDLVLPRLRAIASALLIMAQVFIGLSLGPYVVGLVSDALAASGMSSGEALREAMLWGLSAAVLAFVSLVLAINNIDNDEATRLTRARQLGEKI